MIDFIGRKKGDLVIAQCCDSCARQHGAIPKMPADSGDASWLCDVCGHHGIGSAMLCEIGDWLTLRVLTPNAKVSGGGINARPVGR